MPSRWHMSAAYIPTIAQNHHSTANVYPSSPARPLPDNRDMVPTHGAVTSPPAGAPSRHRYPLHATFQHAEFLIGTATSAGSSLALTTIRWATTNGNECICDGLSSV